MGMFDNVVILDEPLACQAGHSLSGLQTKSFRDPSMGTYLIAGGRVLLAARSAWHDDSDEDERSAWRITGDEAVRESPLSAGARVTCASIPIALIASRFSLGRSGRTSGETSFRSAASSSNSPCSSRPLWTASP